MNGKNRNSIEKRIVTLDKNYLTSQINSPTNSKKFLEKKKIHKQKSKNKGGKVLRKNKSDKILRKNSSGNKPLKSASFHNIDKNFTSESKKKNDVHLPKNTTKISDVDNVLTKNNDNRQKDVKIKHKKRMSFDEIHNKENLAEKSKSSKMEGKLSYSSSFPSNGVKFFGRNLKTGNI
uniref:Uncharacterized protein n=1 Tax=Meloidogyne hapla TaxID=6305 RepID=A0A1I8BXD2_MELHA